MAKKTNPTTENKPSENNRKAWKDYYCTLSFKMKPISEAGKDEIARRLKTWASNEDAFRLDDFLDGEGIRPADYYDWIKTSKNLKEAHEFAIRRLASNRERGAAVRKYDAATIARTIGFYCPISKSEQERLAALRKTEDEIPSNVKVEIVQYPSTDMVPDKKDKKE